MNVLGPAARLVDTLEVLGYTEELRRDRVGSPTGCVVADVVGFTHLAPQDLRTSAISAFIATGDDVGGLLEAARLLATPFALVEDTTGELCLYRVTAAVEPLAEIVRRIPASGIPELRGSDLAAELAPRVVRAAKAGMRQLALFPVDARLLMHARDRSVDSISSRLEDSFKLALEKGFDPTGAAKLAIESLAAVIVRDKYELGDVDRGNVVDAALVHHGEYFEGLAEWQIAHPGLVESMLGELGDGVDYSAIDARSINAVYEQLFLTPDLRKELGIFHTGQRLASRILDHLPVEEIPPEDRYVVDPACGTGNLLLAAQERLENISPGRWSPEHTHKWLKTHMYGADIEPMAVEVAKLSLLVSSLPLGNSWQIEQNDALADTVSFHRPPTVWVTNPPWRCRTSAQGGELAVEFLNRAVGHLADGGLLACILPASWLSTSGHAGSRRELLEKCDVFEVWRLPRDMFNEARFPAAVVFAQKRRTAQRTTFAFRWLTAGSRHRTDFLDSGAVQFQSAEQTRADAALIGGPIDGLTASGITVGDVAELSGGLIQHGTPCPAPHGEGIPVLARGVRVGVHRMVGTESVTRVSDPAQNFRSYVHPRPGLLDTPKLLVQADRNPANAWRLRPVVDTIGVVPSDSWQIVAARPQTVWALNALFSTSVASCFVHSRSITKRITVEVLKRIPLPSDWHRRHEQHFADLGRQMADRTSDLPSLADEAERLARRAFDLDDETTAAIERIMAGYQASDGRVRFPDTTVPRSTGDAHASGFNQAPGTVLHVERTKVGIWVLGGPEEGFTVDLHEGIPGWLLEEHASFDLTGDPQTGRYRFHRAAHLSDNQVFGSTAHREPTPTAVGEHDPSRSGTRPRYDNRSC